MSSKRDVTVKALSSNLLQMKFMKRSALESQTEDDKELFRNDAEHWAVNPQLSKKKSKDMELQPSHAFCEDLGFGRVSFKGFNPAIEKIMRAMNGEPDPEEETITVEDKQFAEQYASVANIAKKFSTKKQRGDHGEKPYHRSDKARKSKHGSGKRV